MTVLCAVPSDAVEFTLDVFNCYQPHFQFTVETEPAGCVCFLDTRAIRKENGNLCSTVAVWCLEYYV